MKKLTRIICLCLAVSIVMAMSVTAFAARGARHTAYTGANQQRVRVGGCRGARYVVPSVETNVDTGTTNEVVIVPGYGCYGAAIARNPELGTDYNYNYDYDYDYGYGYGYGCGFNRERACYVICPYIY